ncbi:MAG: hypothetical protein CVU39_04055 [Chloroflexi bacterium HGW-Chloroflexi-10]|nr:MAG: hypothetical protein CVU39_04055 [Chloroflexi bacterium HGW-Chloroflexi-10]
METNFWVLVLVGFFAQLIDGSLGMAYGVSSNSFLLGVGVPPAAASASVHTAEVFTTAISGISHWRLGNIDKRMVWGLLIPGVIGGALGAYILTNLDGNVVKPYIAIYLLIMGIRILFKAFNLPQFHEKEAKPALLIPLGLAGGTFDAIGGGGWGPIVTSTLISAGHTPRKTIGSVNFSEFFVTLTTAVTFLITIGITHWKVVLGLILGGILAAPLGALLTKKVSPKVIMMIVGFLIILLQIRTLYQIWF